MKSAVTERRQTDAELYHYDFAVCEKNIFSINLYNGQEKVFVGRAI
jgi:hypothetical protein